MTLTSHPDKSTSIRLSRIVGHLMLLLVSGCGLAMDSEDRLDRGEKAFADGEYRAAIIDAKNVLVDEPDNRRGRLLLGRASIEVGDGAAAEKELRRAMQSGTTVEEVAAELARALLIQGKFDEVLSEVPFDGLASKETEADVRAARGDAYLSLNQPEAAREMYSSALQLQPENLDARLGIVSSFVAEDNFAQARGGIDQILETFSDNPRVWSYSGSFNAQLGDFESAKANFSVAMELASSQGDKAARLQAIAGLAESLLEQQEVDAARARVDQLAVEAPDSLQTKFLIARVAYIDEEWTTAQQNLQQILQAAPNYRPAQMLLGAVHLRSGNLSQAEMYLSAVVAAVPDDVSARQLLAETQLQMQKTDEAQEALAPIVSGANADAMSLEMAARASLGRQDVDEALKYLQRNVDENPGNVDLQFQLAATLLQAGRHEEAQVVLDAVDVSGSEENAYRRDAMSVMTAIRDGKESPALRAAKEFAKTYSDRSGAFNLLGVVQLANRDMDAAWTSFEQAAKIEPKDIMSRQYLAAIEASNGEFDAAANRYAGILADEPNATWAMFALGRIAFLQQDYEAAAESFRHALEVEPDNADYRLSLARAEKQLGDNNLATQVLEDEIEASLEHLPSAVMLGRLKAESGDVAGAMEIAKRLQKQYPDNPVSYAFEGEVHVFGGNLLRADSAYEKALSLGPEKSHALRAYGIKRKLGIAGAERPLIGYLETRPLDNEVRVILAESYMQTGNFSKSIATYELVVSEEPANVIALNNLAWNYYLTDDPRAISTAKKAHDAMPGNGAVLDTLGWIMVQQGAVEDGEKLLRKAIEMENGRAEIRYHHAVALVKIGDKIAARATLQQILESEEEFASRNDAEKLLAKL